MARMQKAADTVVVAEDTPRKSLFDRMAGFLDANDWHYQPVPQKGYFDMRVGIRYASVRVILDTDDMDNWQRVLAYSVLPVQTPENRRGAMLEAINRINHAMVFGNLELDMQDGEIRVRTVVESETELPEALMERVLHANLNAANRYFAPLMAVGFGSADPATVLEMAVPADGATVQ